MTGHYHWRPNSRRTAIGPTGTTNSNGQREGRGSPNGSRARGETDRLWRRKKNTHNISAGLEELWARLKHDGPAAARQLFYILCVVATLVLHTTNSIFQAKCPRTGKQVKVNAPQKRWEEFHSAVLLPLENFSFVTTTTGCALSVLSLMKNFTRETFQERSKKKHTQHLRHEIDKTEDDDGWELLRTRKAAAAVAHQIAHLANQPRNAIHSYRIRPHSDQCLHGILLS